ncbi:hypothetical protein GCM10023220_47210 [Streptomyces ziwulingensis]|uniref:Uncharacterized protein n=1 Tax=Streptomyces ziwulingensis TaxID=1045501 RepID=A0ABP9CI05_9ACTN
MPGLVVCGGDVGAEDDLVAAFACLSGRGATAVIGERSPDDDRVAADVGGKGGERTLGEVDPSRRAKGAREQGSRGSRETNLNCGTALRGAAQGLGSPSVSGQDRDSSRFCHSILP